MEIGEMVRSRSTILFCAIARNGIVVTHSASSVGNFSQLTNSLLKKMASDLGKPSRKIFSHADLLFHCVSTNSGLVALSITSLDHDPADAFTFLDSVLEKFMDLFNSETQSARASDIDREFSPIIALEMERHSEKKKKRKQNLDGESMRVRTAKISSTRSNVQDLKEVMETSIEVVIERGEKMELLVGKVENLVGNSKTFKTAPTSVQRAVWVKNMKLTIVLGIVVSLLLYVFVSLSCVGLSWSLCMEE